MKCDNPKRMLNIISTHMRNNKKKFYVSLADALDRIGHTDDPSVTELQGFVTAAYCRIEAVDIDALFRESGPAPKPIRVPM